MTGRPPPPPVTPRRTRTRERAAFLAAVLVDAVQGPISWWADSDHLSGPDPDDEMPDAQVVLIDRDGGAVYPVTVEDIARAVWAVATGRVPGLDRRDAFPRRVWQAQRGNQAQDLTDDDRDLIMQAAVFGRFAKGAP